MTRGGARILGVLAVLILVVGSLVMGLVGLMLLSQATGGVGLVACACLVGIYARLVQAAVLDRGGDHGKN